MAEFGRGQPHMAKCVMAALMRHQEMSIWQVGLQDRSILLSAAGSSCACMIVPGATSATARAMPANAVR
jgi:hypothetical protein